jgi:hypothetical protein
VGGARCPRGGRDPVGWARYVWGGRDTLQLPARFPRIPLVAARHFFPSVFPFLAMSRSPGSPGRYAGLLPLLLPVSLPRAGRAASGGVLIGGLDPDSSQRRAVMGGPVAPALRVESMRASRICGGGAVAGGGTGRGGLVCVA